MAPKKAAKRAAAAVDTEEEAKKPKKEAAPKRDKNAPVARSPTPRAPEPAAGSRVLKLLSLNVAGLRAVLNGDKAKLLQALVEREAPDVLCLNETKLKEEDVADCEAKLKELLPKEYATVHWACCTVKKGYSGVGVLLRHAPEGSGPAAIPDPAAVVVARGMGELGKDDPIIADEGRLLTLEFPELTVLAVYVPNSGMDLKRLTYRTDRTAKQCWDKSMGEYARHLEKEKGKPVVVIGDLNCCHCVQDMWNMYDRPDFPEGLAAKPVPEQYTGLSSLKKFAGLTPEERLSFPQLLEDGGLVDTFRALHPDASGVFSYFSQRVVANRPMNKGLRLDYTLASSSLCGHLKPSSSVDSADAKLPEGESTAADLPLPRVHDSFVLDQDDLVADHSAIGCHVLLPKL